MVEIRGPFFGPKNVRKKQARNMGLPSSRLQLQMWLVLNQLQLTIFRTYGSVTLQQMYPNEGAKNWTLQMEPLLISRGSLFDPFWYMFALYGGPKLDPQNVESGAVLEVPF